MNRPIMFRWVTVESNVLWRFPHHDRVHHESISISF